MNNHNTINSNSGRKQQRWSMISTSTNTSNSGPTNNGSLRLSNNNSNFKRYSMSSLNHTSMSSLSLDTVTLNSDDNVSGGNNHHSSHRKTASVEESLVNINIEKFSTNSNNANSNTTSGGSGATMSSSDFMFTSITEGTSTSVSNSLSMDKTKKRYSGYLNDYVGDNNPSIGSNNNNFYKNSSMTHSKSISSLSNIIASANTNNSNPRRVPNATSTMSLKRGAGIPKSHSNASINSHLSTTSQSSKSSKWMFWKRKSMMSLSDYGNENETNLMRSRQPSVSSTQPPNFNILKPSHDIDGQSVKPKSSIDSIKSKIKMKLFQESPAIEIERPLTNGGLTDSPKSNISASSMGRVPKRSSFISLKRPSKSNLRSKTSQQSLLRSKNSRESIVTVNANGNMNNGSNIKGSGTPSDDMMNHSKDNNTNYSKHYTFDTHLANYKLQQQQIFTDREDSESGNMMDNFIKLCYKVDSISRIFQRINSNDIYYQRDTTVVTKSNNSSDSTKRNYSNGTSTNTISKYLAFDTLDNHKIELILKEIDITKKMTCLLREKLIAETGDDNISLKQVSDTYGISPILKMTLISNIFPEDYSKKNFHIMINKLYDMRENESYSCILKIEYFDLGIPLSIFLQKSPKPSSRVISKIFIKILHLLSQLENFGFQHQDLNLDNIIINSSYKVYIIDYKICKYKQEIDTRLDHPIFYKRDSPHYEVYLEMRKVIPYIQKTGDNFGWCHIIWIKYILSKMLESINNNRDKHYDTLMNWLKFILKHQADLENCRDLISYQKKKK